MLFGKIHFTIKDPPVVSVLFNLHLRPVDFRIPQPPASEGNRWPRGCRERAVNVESKILSRDRSSRWIQAEAARRRRRRRSPKQIGRRNAEQGSDNNSNEPRQLGQK